MDKQVVDYFMQVTGEKFSDLNQRLDKADAMNERNFKRVYATLEELKKVKWMWTGGFLVLNVFLSAAVALAAAYIAK